MEIRIHKQRGRMAVTAIDDGENSEDLINMVLELSGVKKRSNQQHAM